MAVKEVCIQNGGENYEFKNRTDSGGEHTM